MFFSAQDDEMRCTTPEPRTLNLEPINLNPEPLIFYLFGKIEYTCKRYRPFLIYNNSSYLL